MAWAIVLPKIHMLLSKGELTMLGLKNIFKQELEKPKAELPLAIDKNSAFVYQGGADVQKVWRKYGWIPPSEYRTDYEFGKKD